jgi:hypothetical protein
MEQLGFQYTDLHEILYPTTFQNVMKIQVSLVVNLTRVTDTLHEYVCSYVIGKGKGKVIPLQALTDLKVSKRLRLPDFKTSGT